MKATYGKRKWSAAKSAHWVWPSQAPAPSTRQDSKLISSCIFCCVTSLPGVMWCGMMNTRWHHNKNNSPKKHMFTINDYHMYIYIILYHNSWTSPWAPPLEWILPKQLLPRGLQQTEIHRIPQGGAPFFSSTASIHTWIPRPVLQHETQVLAGNKNQKRKGPQASQKKTYADFCCSNLLWTWCIHWTSNKHPGSLWVCVVIAMC